MQEARRLWQPYTSTTKPDNEELDKSVEIDSGYSDADDELSDESKNSNAPRVSNIPKPSDSPELPNPPRLLNPVKRLCTPKLSNASKHSAGPDLDLRNIPRSKT